MMKGIAFDFNGTMFFDEVYQFSAWIEYFKTYLNRELGYEEYKKYVCGPSNLMIFKHYYGEDVSFEFSVEHAEIKELIYRKLVLEDVKNRHLVHGFVELVERLQKANIP